MPLVIPRQDNLSKREADLLRSGASIGRNASARVGFLPLALDHLILGGLAEIPIFLRISDGRGKAGTHPFTLYCAATANFTEQHRKRLRESGVQFIYIPLHDQMRFRRQVEAHLEAMMIDPALATSAKASLVYDTSVELINELLTEQDFAEKIPRLETVAKAVTTLIMNDADAFSHLFAASQHDFYTATHMVNVGTWMVPLAYALGIHDMGDLNCICMAGMVHDIGKLYVSEEVLNKTGRLSPEDWRELRDHAALGANHLRKFPNIPEIVLRVTLEHHERMNGQGYPSGLSGDQIHQISRICAVVDSFDAMTAFRPFKDRTQSFDEALQILQRECPDRYDPFIMAAWVKLIRGAECDGALVPPLKSPQSLDRGRRAHQRFTIDCPARMHRLEFTDGQWTEGHGVYVTAHSFSRAGLGFLSPQPARESHYVRIHLMGTGTLSDRTLEGQVVRCREYTDGWHEIGIRFASPQTEQAAAEKVTLQDDSTLHSEPRP